MPTDSTPSLPSWFIEGKWEGERHLDKDIQFTDFQRYMKGVGFAPVCPMCHSVTWAFISEKDDMSYASINLGRSTRDILSARVANMLLLKCNRCAFVANFLREPVVLWLSENPVGAAANE